MSEAPQYTEGQGGGPSRLEAAQEQEIDLVELFYKLVENLKYIILAAIAGTLIAGVYVFCWATPVYEARSELYVMANNDSAVNLSDLQIGAALTSDYQEIFNTWEIHEMVLQNLGLNYTYDQLRSMLTITNPRDTRILYITVKSDDPAEAQLLANEYATVARTYIADKMATEAPNVLSNALLPSKPVSPKKAQTLIMGFLLGALLAVGIIVVRFLMDDLIKTADDIRKYVQLPTLAVIPAMPGLNDAPNAKKRRKKKL